MSQLLTHISLKGRRALVEINLIDIQNELIRLNPNINNIQVHKIKHYFHIIKVVCDNTVAADAVIREGCLLSKPK